MGYLFTQILIWLLLAAALGVLVGWLLWGRRDDLEKCLRDSRNLRSDLERTQAKLTQFQANEQSAPAADEKANAELQAAKAEAQRLRAEVELARNALKANRDELESARSAVKSETSGIRTELEKTRADLQAARTEAESARSESAKLRTDLQQAHAELADRRASQAATPAHDSSILAEAQPPKSASTRVAPAATEAPPEDWKPNLLSAPQGEKQDLKRIKGVGPKIEGILNDLGIYHFSQIADFTEENVAWVNNHLKFKGRIERENWIAQAKQLASGGET